MARASRGRRLRRVLRRAGQPAFWQGLLTGGVLKPAYFTLLLRWCTWLIAALLLLSGVLLPVNRLYTPPLLIASGLWLLLQMLYLPILRGGLPASWRRSRLGRLIDHGALISALDILLAGLAIYLTGGWGSPFYLYGLATVVMPALLFGYRAALAAGGSFALLYAGSVALNEAGWQRVNQPGAIDGFIQYTIIAIPFALFAAYLGHVLRQLEAARDRTRRALADERVLQQVTTSGLHHIAAPQRFVDETIRAVQRGRAFRTFGIAYRQPPSPAGAPTGLRSRGFGPVHGLLERLEEDEALAADDVLVLPLRQGDRQLGRLVVDRQDAERRQSFVLALAGQVAAALANAHLYAETETLATQAERARLAREIHDGIAQTLFMLTLNLEACAELVERDSVIKTRLELLIRLARQALWQVRHYIHDLKPLLADEQSLGGVVANQVEEFRTITGLPVELSVVGDEAPMAPAVKQALYRIMQEGLANVFKHAGARQVAVELAFTADGSRLTIVDDGRGFPPGALESNGRRGFGLTNMRERATELGGRFELSSQPGAGARLVVWMPAGVIGAGSEGRRP